MRLARPMLSAVTSATGPFVQERAVRCLQCRFALFLQSRLGLSKASGLNQDVRGLHRSLLPGVLSSPPTPLHFPKKPSPQVDSVSTDSGGRDRAQWAQ